MKQIKNFDQFERGYKVLESDGFGTMPYLEKKNGNIYYYFFKLDPVKGEEQKGYMLTLGKYSQYEDTPGAKNSYAVINVNEIGSEIIDDIAIDKKEIPSLLEVSIGHALIADAIYLGLENTIQLYKRQLQKL